MKPDSDPATTLRRRTLRWFKGHVLRDRQEREAARWFRDRGDASLRLDYPLTAASVVLDCGGFEGDWAAAIHRRYGCRVCVFEPVPSFLSRLDERFSGQPSVQCFGYGLHSRNERARLRLDGNASSMFAPAAAASEQGQWQDVDLRDVAEVLPELGLQDLALVKINIEGGEYELLERLIATGLVGRIEHLQIQFHRFVPDAVQRRERIRAQLGLTHTLSYDYTFIWESWRRH
jgi:FkbM family methyltransferase